jgi:DNA-binding response OmpR family regulator
MRRRILVIDDSQVCLDVVKLSLEEAGYDVITTTDPMQLPELIRDRRPQLALVDVEMPKINGARLVELCRISGLNQGMVIILHSGRSPEELPDLAFRVKAAHYLHKTDDQVFFVKQVTELFDRYVGRSVSGEL